MKRFKAFTLTELMVALTVIGVIVAVVTPTIMRTRPNKNKMMIKKTFYTAQQVVSSLINDPLLYPDKTENCYDDDADTTCYWGFDDETSVSFEGNEYTGGTKFTELFKSKLNVSSVDENDVTTTDGTVWTLDSENLKWEAEKKVGTFDNQTDASGIGTIIIDVNGDETPNCREGAEGCGADNFDRYQVQILVNGKMRIDAADEKAIEYATINTSVRD